jgi:DNA polymerase-3 subunit delta'
MWKTIGQPEALSLIKHSLQTSSLAHAYLLVGAPHIGKMTLALDLACTLNCDGKESPCGECQPCRRIIEGKHADTSIISLNSVRDSGDTKARVEIGIDDIRELQRNASLPPFEGRYKIFVIDGAEYLSIEAANCLLKTIEEPPPQVIILMLTADESKLLPTVVSRCQRLELKPMPTREIEKILTKSYGVNPDKASLLSRLSQGCLGWATTVASDDSYLSQRDQKLSEMISLLTAGWQERFSYAAKLGSERKSAEDTIRLWLFWWRDVMLIKCGCKHSIINIDYIPVLEQWNELLSLSEIRDFIDRLQKSLNQIALNANLRLIFEILMLDIPRKERAADISSVPVK